MSVNGVTDVSAVNTYSTYTSGSKKTADKAESATDKPTDGVVYEKSDSTKKYTQHSEVVARLKADSEARAAQFKTLVEQMMSKQGTAIGKSDDMWKFLAGGKFTVSPEVKAQAQADIAEDGYWGVSKTSDRIIEFAKALTGGDPAKLETMRDAFEKGFKQATKTWGKQLPDICQRTYGAVMDKFDQWANESDKKNTTTVTD